MISRWSSYSCVVQLSKDNYLNMYLLTKISCTSWSTVSVDARIIRLCIAKCFDSQREGAFRPNQLTVVRTHHFIIGKKGMLRCSYIKEYISTLMLRWITLHTFVRLQHFLFVCKISLCRHEVQTDVIHLMDEYLCCCSVSAHCGWVGLRKCCKGIHSVLICSHEGWSDTKWFLRPKGRLLWVPSGLNAAHLTWGGIYYDGR